ncbi:uncharacterized protein LOC134048168 [Cinclus cinclus]|uniref:uncharacterized protein LOC134048168 n=1 Tax=Cinclus cinclus TaxID=127875 RepID=UPI002E14C4E2
MAAERELGPGAAAGDRGAAGGCPCSALPAPRQGLMEEARRPLREFEVGDKFCRLPLPRAAVLLPLVVRLGRLHLLLTVRSMQLRRSPGEVCFPGGKREATDDDDIDTALREAKEEGCLEPEKVEVMCRLMPGIDKLVMLWSTTQTVLRWQEFSREPRAQSQGSSEWLMSREAERVKQLQIEMVMMLIKKPALELQEKLPSHPPNNRFPDKKLCQSLVKAGNSLDFRQDVVLVAVTLSM